MMEPSDFLSGSEVRKLLGDISTKTLDRWRLKYWTEGVHYVQPVHRVQYIKPMIIDWMLNGKADPAAHQLAMEEWVKAQRPQGKGKRRAG
jgi:hypothetical protein